MNTLIFIQIDVKSRRIGGATQPLGLRWDFETTSSTLESMATPCSVNTKGRYFECCPLFKVTFCDLKDWYSFGTIFVITANLR